MALTPRSTRIVPRILIAGFVVALVATSLPAQAQFGKNKISYREFDWKIYHSPHFDVYFYEEARPSLEKVVSMAESAYDELSRRLDFQIQEPTPLIFYATHSAFEQNNIILNFIPEGVGAFATPNRFRMVLPIDLPDADLYALVKHELTHIFEYHILFQGNLGKALTARPPTWLMEGMASYLGDDEQSWDQMFLRDAVVNDQIPPITQTNIQGFFAYRFGHAVLDFMEERWGDDGLLDFLYEYRNTIGGRVGPAVERAFRMDGEEFDIEFRRWLRRKYLPELVATGEPSDFGRVFRVDRGLYQSQETSPVASPSGDLLAAFVSFRGELDIALFDTRERRFVRNLTKGYTDEYQYLIGQLTTVGRGMGRDLAFSPDGNLVAAFAKRERGRSLLLVDVLQGGIERIIDMDELGVEQQLSPAFSPDGRTIAFAAWRDNDFDIFLYDLGTGQLTNLTDDQLFDGAPTFAPDGQTVVYSAVLDGYQKLFRIDVDDPSQRYQITSGEFHDRDATFSPDGSKLYFTSDRTGAENIFSLDLGSGELVQQTNVITGTFMPTVFPAEEGGGDELVYAGFWKQRMDLYLGDLSEPIGEGEAEILELPDVPADPAQLPRFEPDIQVSLDPDNEEPYGGWKLFLDDAQTYIGVDDDQTFLGRIQLNFTDYLGDRRVIADLSSVSSFQDFDILYLDQSKRLDWGVRVFDDRFYFLTRDLVSGRLERLDSAYRETGLQGLLIFPFSFYTRMETGLAYKWRKINFNNFVRTDDGDLVQVYSPREDNYPEVSLAFVGDSSIFAPWGPIDGRRWRVYATYAPNISPEDDEGSTLTTTYGVDARQYVNVTQRSNLAFRVAGFVSDGEFRQPFAFGGLDTVRGYDFRSLLGDRGFYANAEYRFPLIDVLRTPILQFDTIRGVVFFDLGGAWFDEVENFDLYDSDLDRLDDAVASYGFGVTVRLLGLDVNWDFAKQYDLDQSSDGFRTSFWIGRRF
jgi:Tol biopolymer transport system component